MTKLTSALLLFLSLAVTVNAQEAVPLKPPADVTLDGLDLAPVLKDTDASLDRDALFFHYPHYYSTTTPVSAIRSGDWKLLEYLKDDRVELFNLKDDLGETNNLADQLPKKATELRKRIHRWREESNASMPTPNPNFKSKRAPAAKTAARH